MVHIVNGHSTKGALSKTNIQGTVVVWNEVLSEGKTTRTFDSEFWSLRKQQLTSFFDLEDQDYQKQTKNEIDKIDQIPAHTPLTLWYEYDYFCQINLIGLLAFFHQKGLENPMQLICVGFTRTEGTYQTLGSIRPEDYPKLLSSATPMDVSWLKAAHAIWEAYNAPQKHSMMDAIRKSKAYFPYFHGAFLSHLKRYPSANNLTEIEYFILAAAKQKPSLHQLFIQIFEAFHMLGLGDSQYFQYIQNLGSLLNLEDKTNIRLTKSGEKVLSGTEPFTSRTDYYYGNTSTKLNKKSASNLFGFEG